MDDKTKEYIPISALDSILLDKNEMELFFNFEANRNHFSQEHSYDEYYNALDSYVAQLIKEDYSLQNKQLIASFVENFLLKNMFTDKFFGSHLLMTCINPTISYDFSLISGLESMINIFRESQSNAKNHYLKVFAESNLELNENLQNILTNMINFYGDFEFVSNLFFSGNESLKKYLIYNYPLYFSLENMTNTQLKQFCSYFNLLLKINNNRNYLVNMNLNNIKIGKMHEISSIILSSDEMIVAALSNIKFKDTAFIKYLVSKLSSKNVLNFEAFSATSALSNMRLYDLRNVLLECDQDTIFSLLTEFKDWKVFDGYSQDLYLALLTCLLDSEKQKIYILASINNSKRFNYKTIYNLLLYMNFEDALSLLSDSIFINHFNLYEMAFLLKLLQMSEPNIVEFIKGHYGITYDNYQHIRNEYIIGLQKEVSEKRNVVFLKSLYYAFGSGETSILNYVSIDDILKTLFSDYNLDKEIDVSTMGSILYFFFNHNLKSNEVEVSIQSPMYFKCVDTMGVNISGRKQIVMNDSAIQSTPRGNKKIISSFFHEKSHYLQEEKMKNADPDFNLIQIAKELHLYNKLVYGNGNTTTSENYCKLGIECDANLRSVIETISFFNQLNPEFLKSIYPMEKLNMKSFLENRKLGERKDLIDNIMYDTDHMFDVMSSKSDINNLIHKYPVLLYEYHANGEKKTVVELISELNFCLKKRDEMIASGESYDKYYFARRIRTSKELLKKRQTFLAYNKEIISNKKERFNDWVLLINSLGRDEDMDIQIIDYLITSILSFLQVATSQDLNDSQDVFKILYQKLGNITLRNTTVSDKEIYSLLLEELKTYRQSMIDLRKDIQENSLNIS